jgi:hypothetical protein
MKKRTTKTNLKRKEVKMMKKSILILFLMLVLLSSAAYGGTWTGSVYNGSTGTFIPGITEFDWDSSGSGVAVGAGPIGTPLTVGSTYVFDYQSRLTGVKDINGILVPFTGLDTAAFEYTVVATFPEIVTAAPVGPAPALGQALFSTLAGGEFRVYYDIPGDSNVANGTGFLDGTLVMSGTIDAGLPSIFSLFIAGGQLIGQGSTFVTGLVNYVDPNYFDPAISIFDIEFRSQLFFPPQDSTTTTMFAGGSGLFAPHTVLSNDLLLKADGSSRFSTVPEPSTLILLGAGILGLMGFARRKSE